MAGTAPMPTMIVAGNCQARFLSLALAECPEIGHAYRVIYFRDFRKGGQGDIDPEDVANCAVFFEQVAHRPSMLPGRDSLPADCRIIRFPILWMNTLWPFAFDDPRNQPTDQNPRGPYPYGDKLILKFLDQGMSPEEASRAYLETDVSELIDLDRLHEINVEKMVDLDNRSDVKFGSYLIKKFARKKLFVSRNHPTMKMLRYMRDLLFAQLDVTPPPSDLVKASGGMGHLHIPIHPQIGEHFGLEWYDPEAVYPYDNACYTIGEYLRRYAAFE